MTDVTESADYKQSNSRLPLYMLQSNKVFCIREEHELIRIAQYLSTLLSKNKIILLLGDLGMGKTALVKALLPEIGLDDAVSSPTYSIVNEYQGPSQTVYHMDLYRLESINEALEIGIEEYLYSDKICLIEWPEIILNLIEGPYIEVRISILDDSRREFLINEMN